MSPVTTTTAKKGFSWRLGFAHELGVGLSATIAVLIVLMGGAFPLPAWGVLLAPLLSSALVVRGIEAPRFSGTALALAGIGLGVAQVLARGTEVLVYGGGIALLGILAGRLVTRRTLAHDIQTIILALVLVMAGSVLNPGLSYGILFGCFGITVIWALTTRQLLSAADAFEQEQGEGTEAAVTIRERTDIVTPSFFAVTGGVAIAVLLATSVVFVAFPRVGLGSLSFLSSQKAGFPTSVNLNGGGINGGGVAVTARAYFVPQKSFLDGLYLRGMVFDAITTQGAGRSETSGDMIGVATHLAPGPGGVQRYMVMMEPVADDLALSLGPISKSQTVKGGRTNPNRRVFSPSWNERGELSVGQKIRTPVRYALAGTISAPGYVPPKALPTEEDEANDDGASAGGERGPTEDQRGGFVADEEPDSPARKDGAEAAAATVGAADANGDVVVDGKIQRARAQRMAPSMIEIPDDLPPELVQLAVSFGPPESNIEDVVGGIRTFLMTEFSYTLSQPNGFKADPLVAFLLEDRRGHCEYFASAFVLLLRMQGIPARVVGGYQGGEYDGVDDVVIFRERNAHAWVEWLHPDHGWIVDDATPMATAEREYLTGLAAIIDRMQRLWGDAVVDYSLGSQVQLASEAVSSTSAFLQQLSGHPLKIVGGAGLLLAMFLVLRRVRRRRQGTTTPIDPLSLALEAAAAAALQRPIPSTWTLREAVIAVDAGHPAVPTLRRALRVHERVAFAGHPAPAAEIEALVATLVQHEREAKKRADG